MCIRDRLCSQPVVEEVKKGLLTNAASYFGSEYEKRWRKDLKRERAMEFSGEEQA